MAIPHYLAMTAAEMAAAPLPPNSAWMACHFSPYSTGLTNLPTELPKGSLLILNDRTPMHGHDPERICDELKAIIQQLSCYGLLIDFQNPRTEESAALVKLCVESLPCPVGAPVEYRMDNAAVFLPPIPVDTSPEAYLAQWKHQELWLETALDGQTIRVTTEGTIICMNTCHDFPNVFQDNGLCCHYSIQDDGDSFLFHTWRTREDLQKLLETAEALDVKIAVGLYQEFRTDAITH